MTDAHLPLPEVLATLHSDSWTQHYWGAAHEHRLSIPRCAACGTFRMPPSPFCHLCRSQDVDWIDSAGSGSVYTFIVVRHPLMDGLERAVPYVVAVIELDDAPDVRLIASIVGVDPDDVKIGMPVRVVYDDVTPDVTVPRFAPA